MSARDDWIETHPEGVSAAIEALTEAEASPLPEGPELTRRDDRRRNGCATEAERQAYAEGLDDAAQRARYLLKHQNFEGDEADTPYTAGFTNACEILDDLLTKAAEEALSKPLIERP